MVFKPSFKCFKNEKIIFSQVTSSYFKFVEPFRFKKKLIHKLYNNVCCDRIQLWILAVAYFFSWSSTFFIFSYLKNASIRGCIIGSLICGKSCKKEMKNIKKIKAKHQRSSRNIKNTINNDSNIGKSIVLMNTS